MQCLTLSHRLYLNMAEPVQPKRQVRKPCVLSMGCLQTVYTQTNTSSYQGLHCLLSYKPCLATEKTSNVLVFRLLLNSRMIKIILEGSIPHRVGDNRKHSKQSTNADQKSLKTVFLIAICRQSGDEWQSKTMFLAIFFIYVRR